MQTSRASGLTLGHLIESPVMSDVHVHPLTGTDQPVESVRLVDHVDQLLTFRPETIVVLQPSLAGSAWAVSVSLRYAWERNLRFVISGLDKASAPPVLRLAERLSVPLGIYNGSMPDLAIGIASLIGSSGISRALAISSIALEVARETTESGVLAALNRALPGAGVVLEKRRTKDPEGDPRHRIVRVHLGQQDLVEGRSLVAILDRPSDEWAETVEQGMLVARSGLIACGATAYIESFRDSQVEAWVLARIMSSSSTSAASVVDAALELGWHEPRRVAAAKLLAPDATEGERDRLGGAMRAAWRLPGVIAPIPFEDGWAVWTIAGDSGTQADPRPIDLRRLVSALENALEEMALTTRVVVGVGVEAAGFEGLADSLRLASLAADSAARQATDVLAFGDVGGNALAIGAIRAELAPRILDRLGALLDETDADVLIDTLSAYLDAGGSPSRTAKALGLHRNTVAARIDRIRSLGIEPDDTDERLTLHLSASFARTHAHGDNRADGPAGVTGPGQDAQRTEDARG